MATITVTSLSDVVDANDGVTTLREAITAAEIAAGDDAIVFQQGFTGSVALTSGALSIIAGNNLSISGDTNGDGNIDIAISGNGGTFMNFADDSHHLTVAFGATVALDSLSFVSGYGHTDDGSNAGSIINYGTLSISGSNFDHNRAFNGYTIATAHNANAQAGAILNVGSLSITESQFQSNYAFSRNGTNGVDGLQGSNGASTGNVAGNILNVGQLTLTRVLMAGGYARSGNAGNGGISTGSYVVDGQTQFYYGGNGGKSGYAAGNIFNLGNISGTVQSIAGVAIVGSAGVGGTSAGGEFYQGYHFDTPNSDPNILLYGTGGVTEVSNLGTFGQDALVISNYQTFYGLSGNDSLSGGLYVSLFGGAGNDALTAVAESSADGGIGNDTLIYKNIHNGIWNGGAGNDTLDVSANTLNNQTFDLNAASFVVNGATFSNFENLIATQGDDIIITKAGANHIDGQGGNDTVIMNADIQIGNVLDGGSGTDTLRSELFWLSSVTFNLTEGFLKLGGTNFDEIVHFENVVIGGEARVIGDGLDNIITVTQTYGANANSINGGGGDDTIEGAQGADILSGDGNNFFGDTVSYRQSAAGVTVNLANVIQAGSGDAAGDSLSGFENVMGSANADSLMGDGGSNVLIGLGGGDTLNGGSGAGDTADYTESDAAVTVSINGAGSASGGHAAGDVLIDIENLTGSGFGDTLTGSTSVNILNGGGGNDTLLGGAGGDILDGGNGKNDTLSYAGSTSVNVNLFLNSAAGGHATGDLFSNVENVTGSSQSDVIAGDANANVLSGALGTGDMITYANSNAFVNVNLTTNVVSGGFAEGDSISGFERVIGSAFDDFLAGTVFANQIAGGNGNDTIYGDAGADNLTGGNGFDTLDHTASAGGVTINLLTGASSGGNAQGDIIGTFERVNGSSGGVDVLTGNAAVNILRGNGGNDFIEGGAGGDTLDGGAGSADTLVYTSSNAAVIVNIGTNTASGGHAQLDIISGFERLTGSSFGDTLTGTTGSNILKGGLGTDSLTGGAGSDTFVFDTVIGATNIDSITDFSVPQDTIQLDNLIFTALTDGALNATQFGFAATADASDRIIYNQTTGQLFYDTNGSTAGGSTQIATLAAGLAMTAVDFFVI